MWIAHNRSVSCFQRVIRNTRYWQKSQVVSPTTKNKQTSCQQLQVTQSSHFFPNTIFRDKESFSISGVFFPLFRLACNANSFISTFGLGYLSKSQTIFITKPNNNHPFGPKDIERADKKQIYPECFFFFFSFFDFPPKGKKSFSLMLHNTSDFPWYFHFAGTLRPWPSGRQTSEQEFEKTCQLLAFLNSHPHLQSTCKKHRMVSTSPDTFAQEVALSFEYFFSFHPLNDVLR